MNATPGPILPKICDWMLNKNYESHTRSQTIGNRFQFPSFRHRVKAITRESRTLPHELDRYHYKSEQNVPCCDGSSLNRCSAKLIPIFTSSAIQTSSVSLGPLSVRNGSFRGMISCRQDLEFRF